MLLNNFLRQLFFPLFFGEKLERESGENLERERVQCEYERESYQKIITKYMFKI
jgi:hypothetical protein